MYLHYYMYLSHSFLTKWSNPTLKIELNCTVRICPFPFPNIIFTKYQASTHLFLQTECKEENYKDKDAFTAWVKELSAAFKPKGIQTIKLYFLQNSPLSIHLSRSSSLCCCEPQQEDYGCWLQCRRDLQGSINNNRFKIYDQLKYFSISTGST